MLHDCTVQLDNGANKVLFMTFEMKGKAEKQKEALHVFTLVAISCGNMNEV